MSGTIIIENLTGRHLQYRLDHQAVCVKFGKCFCRKGRRGSVTTTIHVPGGPGSRTAPLDPSVVLAPQIKADMEGAKPKIKIIGHKPVKDEAKTKAKADSTKPEEKPEKADKKGGGGRKGKKD